MKNMLTVGLREQKYWMDVSTGRLAENLNVHLTLKKFAVTSHALTAYTY